MKQKETAFAALLLAGILLGTARGYLAVWRDGDPQPQLITDAPLRALPPADQALLEAGIRLPDEAALQRALEDFCS